MRELLNNPIFGLLITIIAFQIGVYVNKKTMWTIFHPVLLSILLIIAFLSVFHIQLDAYNKGGDIIRFFLGPATIILAIPLYKKIKIIKKHYLAILIGIFAGSLSAILSVIAMTKLMGIDENLTLSLIPKSITTPIGIEICGQLGGIESITVVAIILTGITGAIIAPAICRMFRIKNKIAIGIAIGTSSHALGTAKALEIGETEGAMSSLTIGVAGLMVVFLAPLLIRLI